MDRHLKGLGCIFRMIISFCTVIMNMETISVSVALKWYTLFPKFSEYLAPNSRIHATPSSWDYSFSKSTKLGARHSPWKLWNQVPKLWWETGPTQNIPDSERGIVTVHSSGWFGTNKCSESEVSQKTERETADWPEFETWNSRQAVQVCTSIWRRGQLYIKTLVQFYSSF